MSRITNNRLRCSCGRTLHGGSTRCGYKTCRYCRHQAGHQASYYANLELGRFVAMFVWERLS